MVEAGVKPGDVVIVPPLTFIAAVNPVKYQFATPVFIDCDDSFCMDPTNTGCYIVEPEVIDDIPEGTFMGFPDMIEKYRSEGKNVGVYPISENAWLDMGEMDALEKMRAHLENKE